jgi:hypothetical protein
MATSVRVGSAVVFMVVLQFSLGEMATVVGQHLSERLLATVLHPVNEPLSARTQVLLLHPAHRSHRNRDASFVASSARR